ncbi:predicted protein [Naegleria gruberi]|uniref:Predicted protein n=1 Tax=Naegleria gruberi TaxID=5762 RepID=D2VQY6_NAEGR|nr:uncharacterized protein NAEGRDRAFT_71392 [Naegleria gruberi]EFC40718.1 predicted protein [Naegleria gruberi]|eukprot:XP_002673462.1 predicted protein [Naegleria gruberi strain NEG-M]
MASKDIVVNTPNTSPSNMLSYARDNITSTNTVIVKNHFQMADEKQEFDTLSENNIFAPHSTDEKTLSEQNPKLFAEFCIAVQNKSYSCELRSLAVKILLRVKAFEYLVSVYCWEGENLLEIRYLSQGSDSRSGIYVQFEADKSSNSFTVLVNLAHKFQQYSFREENQEEIFEFLQHALI